MSTTIDQRVVEMRFDNKQFESGVATTMSTLDKFKKSLHLDGATKGLEEVNSAAKKVDMSGLGDAVEAVRVKFSALQIMGITALQNITNQAVNAGKRIASALTIDPIKTGLSEYETQMGAIQTILANTESKGSTLKDVNSALSELNEYADKTIYNFTEMTRNIGTFTAAGVDLETSVSSIKGIANLAAISGSTSQQASTAMYQLSQAMSSGTVRLMDWNSVVNAGMGGQVFQDALKTTAKAHGVAIDSIIEKNGSFRDSLQEGWLTSEILTDTLTHFTMAAKEGTKEWDEYKESLKSQGYTEEQAAAILKMANTATGAATEVKTFTQLWDTLKESAQSGWAQTWQIIIGDFEEAKQFLTELSDLFGGIIGASAESRNDMLENWKVLGGRTDLLDALRNTFEGIASIVKPVKEAFREIFPPMTAEQLANFTANLKELTAKMKLSDETSDNLKRTFKGLFAIVDIARQAFMGILKAVGMVLGVTGSLGGGLLSITAVFGDWIVQVRDAITYSGIFENVFVGIAKIVQIVIKALGRLGHAISESFVFEAASAGLNALMAVMTRAKDESDTLAESANRIKEAWMSTGLYQFLVKVWDAVTVIASGIAKVFSGLFTAITDAFGKGDIKGGSEIILSLLEGGLLVGLISLVKKIKDFITGSDLFGSLKDMVDGVSELIDGFGDTLASFQNKLKADALQSIAIAIGVLVASLVALSLIDQESMADALAGMTILFAELAGLMLVLGKVDKTNLDTGKFAVSMAAIGVAVLLMASAMKIASNIDENKSKQGLIAVTVLIGLMTGTAIALDRFAGTSNGALKGAGAMVIMGVALLTMSASLAIIGSMNTSKLLQGIIGIGVVLLELTSVQILMRLIKAEDVVKGAAGIAIMAASLNLLIPILTAFAIMNPDRLIQSVLGLGFLIAELVGVQVLMRLINANDAIKGAAGIAIIAGCITLLLPTLLAFAILSIDRLIQAVVGLGVVVAELVGVQILMRLIEPAKAIKGAAGMAIIVGAINLLLPMLLVLASMDWGTLGKVGAGLAGLLAILGGTLALLSKFGGSPAELMGVAMAIKSVATSVLVLSIALKMLSSIGIEGMLVSLGALAGSFVVIGLAAKIMQPMIGTMMAFAVAILNVGAGLMFASASVLLFGIGLTAVAGGIISLVAAVGALGGVLVILIDVVAAVVEGLLVGFARAIVGVCDVFIEGLPAIAGVITALIVALCDVIIDCVPKLVDTVAIVILKVLQSLVQFVPPIVAAIVQLLVGIIDALAGELPALIKSVVNLFFAFVNGIIEAISGMDSGGDLTKLLKNTGMITAVMAALAAMAYLAPSAMVGVLAMGVVITELAGVLAILGVILGNNTLVSLIDKAGVALESIGVAIGKFIGGIVGGIGVGVSNQLPSIGENLSKFATNIKDFIDIAPTLASAISSLAGASILNSIAGLFSISGSGMDMFVTELPKLGAGMAGFADAIGDRDFKNVKRAATGLAAIAEMTNMIPKEGGFMGGLLGNADLDGFARGVGRLGEGLASFTDAIGDRNFDNIQGAVDAAKSLASIADMVPNSGGLVAWFTGDNSLATFSREIADLGRGIAGFAAQVENAGFKNVSAAVDAGKALAGLANTIPNSGGMAAWFTGDNSMAKFSSELGFLGAGIADFAGWVKNVEASKVEAAALAATKLAEMTNVIPNTGGMAAWFTGDNSIAKFGTELGDLGAGISKFASHTSNINADTIGPAIDAAIALAGMTEVIPKEGGIAAWFSGESAISKFGNELADLGAGIAKFAENTTNVSSDTIGPVVDAAISLARITDVIPNEGGIAAWFTGESAISKFGSELGSLGSGIAGFARATDSIRAENVKPAVDAAVSLAEMTKHIPNEGGIAAWFTGESAISKFGAELGNLGKGIAAFSANTTEVVPETVTAAANAAADIAKMVSVIPKEGGIAAWFSGEQSVTKFAGDLPTLGAGIKGFSDKVNGIVPENVTAAAQAAKALAEMVSVIPPSNGIEQWFSGEKSMSKFAGELPKLGDGLSGFSEKVAGIVPENVTAAAQAAKSLGEMTSVIPEDTSKIVPFGENLTTFGTSLKKFVTNTSGISEESVAGVSKAIDAVERISSVNSSGISSASKAIDEVVTSIKSMPTVASDTGTKLNAVLESITQACLNAFKGLGPKLKVAGSDAIDQFASGTKASKETALSACKTVAKACVDAIRDKYSSFKSVGEYATQGFANGMSGYSWFAEQAARSVANAALDAAKSEMREASPSKAMYEIGAYGGEGFVNGLEDYGYISYSVAGRMAGRAIRGLSDGISKIGAAINGDLDLQPTIRPVLDLSDVKAGAGTIGSLFGTGSSIGFRANVNAVSASMNRGGQNGGNGDVVSAIKDLGKKLDKVGNTYNNVGDVTYDDGSNISDAVSSIVRAARIERRI